MLLVVVAVSYATAIAARNAGTPFIAFGQLLMVLLPLSVALLLWKKFNAPPFCARQGANSDEWKGLVRG